MVIVNPAHARRQGHQDGLHPAAGLQTEHGSPVVEQVEFGIPSAAVFLESPLGVRVRLVPAAPDDGEVSVEERIATVADEGKDAFSLEVIEKDAADAARL